MRSLSGILDQPVVARLGWMLLHSLWQGAVVAAVAVMVLRGLRRRSASARYAAACGAIVCMIVWPAATLRSIDGPTPRQQDKVADIETAATASLIPHDSSTAVAIEEAALPPTVSSVPQPAALAHQVTLAERLDPLLPWLVLGWSAGVVALSIRLGGGWLLVQRLKHVGTRPLGGPWSESCAGLARRLGISRPVRLLESAVVAVPMVAGWLRPAILVPVSAVSGLTPSELDAILAHELAHIRRHDYLVNLIQSLAETLLFYHPAVWWLSRRIREEREHCCDDWAVTVCGDRLLYARALSAMEGLRGQSFQLAPAATGGSLLARVRRLLGVNPPCADRPAGWLAGALVLGAMALAGAGSLPVAPRAAEAVDVKVPEGQMTITGRVLSATGQPVPGAAVVVLADHIRPFRGGDYESGRDRPIGHGQTDAEGRFKLVAERTSSAVHRYLKVYARSPGFGLGWREFSPDTEQPDAEIKLPPEQIVRGRAVDLQGQPTAGVKIVARGVGIMENALLEGVRIVDAAPELPVQPPSAVTDAQGRFTFRGLGLGHVAFVAVLDDRFGPDEHKLDSNDPKEAILTLEPARWLEGKVTYEDTGAPVANTRLEVGSWTRGSGRGKLARVDAQGRYRVKLGPAESYSIIAYAPEGAPYLNRYARDLKLAKGVLRLPHDMALPKGILVRGTVTEAPAGKPVSGASVEYRPRRRENSNLRDDVKTGWESAVLSGDDGVFKIAVPPGPGSLLIIGPDRDFVHLEVDERMVREGRPGGSRICPNGFAELDVAPGDAGKDVAVSLRRGVTVKGRIVGPEGQTIAKALVLTRANVSETLGFEGIFPVDAVDGLFELHGLDPAKSFPILCLDPDHEWGAKVEIAGSQAGKDPVTVRLAPCGSARVRVVDRAGKPLAKYRAMLDVVVTPGPHRFDPSAPSKGLMAADSEFYANVDRKHYWKTRAITDAEGRTTLPDLIPGATYLIWDFPRNKEFPVYEFTVKPGETRDLPDFVTTPRG